MSLSRVRGDGRRNESLPIFMIRGDNCMNLNVDRTDSIGGRIEFGTMLVGRSAL